ncbi:glucans biosynthesis glucosyltransferase MdoH [Luteimonas viscosa]|uniref:Glucans biosynthesis glucosyltransferase H n=1 Tax=Luteimonas viscosa TaxID=1132694 RepID=A0A5D4XVQ2_9GAMM|nr:glucans biosynthesis glucosyltransferase MdoH [Luteimonas viscosa]TYT27521.1 glucans biosynthesis glucosyltransferase MdoH [Luteimonas viscosa]
MDAATVAPADLADAPWVPPEAPLAMPVQDLHAGRLANARLPSTPASIGLRRAFVFGGTAALTALAAYQMWWLMRGDGIEILEGVLLVLFVLLFAWIAFSFMGALPGFARVVARRPLRLGLANEGPLPELATRTALLVPVYNEDPRRTLAGVQAILESVAATGRAAHFDCFILSDTRRPEIAAEEERAFLDLRRRLGAGIGLYYRRREDNSERKAGNIAGWVRRFGGGFAHMLILDADSLMSGATIVRLAAAMERHADVALIQTLPLVVNGATVFARMQQFSGRVYGPVVAHGVAWWHGAESNYWGHNAMIRTRAFAGFAGLPELRGREPFGGTVLSHDFVEAALMRRGGWALHMEPGLGGSYEEGPPSLTDMLVRDRRWCQGNLQHSVVLPARGLHWVSRVHLLIGIGHYFTAPMWAMLMLVGLSIPLEAAGIGGGDGGYSPLAYWRDADPERFLWVFALTMALLFAPKLLGFVATLRDRATRRACGGTARLAAGLLLETVLAALMAPVTMYLQSRGVAEVLSGKDSGWDAQRRDDGTLPLSALVARYGGLTLFGVGAGVAAYLVSPGLAAWMSPVIAGLVLSIPVVALTSAKAPGDWLRRAGIFATPEETGPPEILLRAHEIRVQAESP